MNARRFSPTSRAWWLAGLLIPLVVIGGLLGILADSENGLERIPVALVNNDELITELDENGEETYFLASRPLVLELVGSEEVTVDWVVTDSDTANDLLASGEVYAVVEIPEDFSEAVKTLESSSPKTTQFTIRTNPSHNYLSGILAEQVGTSLQAALGDQFSQEIVRGLYTVIIDLGDAIVQASDAANELSDGVTELNSGTRELANGYAEFDDGLQQYADGVGQLSDGLATFSSEAEKLDELTTGVKAYTDQVSQVSGVLSQLAPTLSGNPFEQQLLALIGGLGQLAGSGPALSTGVADAIDGIQDGLEETADGASELADASQELVDGSAEIRSGTAELADGVSELSDGVGEFADGLKEGADQFREEGLTEPSDETLDALVNPVTFQSETQGGEIELRESVASVIVPVGLWVASLALFLTLPPLRPRTLTRTLPSTALLLRLLLPTTGVALTQAAVATTLLHTLGGVQWSGVGVSLLLTGLGALAMMVLHFIVWTWRPTWLVPVSVGALVIQVATLGTLLPAEILPSAYRALSGFGPIAALADGLHALAAEGDISRVLGSAIALGISVLSTVLIAGWVIHRARERVVATYLVPVGTPSR